MELYRLSFTLHEPAEETEDRYLAELPDLPGCRAWGETAAEALENLQSVATAFIASYREKGDPLPPGVEAAAEQVSGTSATSELVVAV